MGFHKLLNCYIAKLLHCHIAILLYCFFAVLTFTLHPSPFSLFSLVTPVLAECPATDFDCQIAELQKEIDVRKDAHEKNKTTLADYEKQLKSLNSKITALEANLKLLEKKILNTEVDLGVQEEILAAKVHSYYINSKKFSPFLLLLSSKNASELVRELSFRQQAASRDRKIITSITENLSGLNTDKQTLEKTKISLASLKAQTAKQTEFLRQEVAKTEGFFAKITEEQGRLEALKAGGFSTSVGDTPPTLEACTGAPGTSNFCDPGFSPAFAAFSFGAPHRTGMSQFGAYGRSKSGQNAETILSAYFQGTSLRKDYPIPSTIGVSGYGRIAFEDNYLLGIYEVPENWGNSGGFEALKAQAVAARSYALAVTNNGAGTICTTEACQVYKSSLKTGKWAEAVRATRGWVLIKDGSPAKAYYASTSGGYTISQWGWSGIKDTSGDWPGTSYEKVAGSPWFYKSWYKSRGGVSCGRGNPWLTSDEIADILNAWKVLTQSVGDASRVSPVGSCWSGNPYPMDELKRIGGYTSVSDVSVIYNNDGYTQTVNITSNKGSESIPGNEFKKAFNLRAPGYIGIKSSLFNLVKK